MSDEDEGTTVIQASCNTNSSEMSNFPGDSYAMKYVLLKGLQRSNTLCDENKLRNLLKSKSFVIKEENSSVCDLLHKIKKNITVFTVADIHSVLNVDSKTSK